MAQQHDRNALPGSCEQYSHDQDKSHQRAVRRDELDFVVTIHADGLETMEIHSPWHGNGERRLEDDDDKQEADEQEMLTKGILVEMSAPRTRR